MGLKSEFYDLAGKLEDKAEELHDIATKLDSIKSEIFEIRSNMKVKADHIKEEQSS